LHFWRGHRLALLERKSLMTLPAQTGEAPSGPSNIEATWASSDKDLVTTALGSSRIWASLGHGILNEVYWPSTGTPQTRDMGFIVSGPFGWSEVKRVNRYTVTAPAPDIPLPIVVHEGEDGAYQLTLEVIPDPARDTLMVRYALSGEGCQVYVLAMFCWPRAQATGFAWRAATAFNAPVRVMSEPRTAGRISTRTGG
jgi:hypothetical protein